MNKPEETIKIKMKPAALRSLAKMIHKMGANEALFDKAHTNELEAAENTIQNMEHEIAKLQQQAEKHEETIHYVTRDRDELLRAVRAVAMDLGRAENIDSSSTTLNGDTATLFWLRDSVVSDVLRLVEDTCDAEKAPEEKSDE
jgi:septal ring factor EnvC (AmiA/AmiB activator)